VRSGWKEAERVANARVDFLQEASGRLLALEVNATIPAMQAYSDIVAQGFVRHAGAALGAPPAAIARALAALHSNVDDLRRSLLAQASETESGQAGRWALLARENDPQDGELAWIAERWREAGLEAVRVAPESYAGPYDLVYRHLFARRVPAGSPLEAIFRAPRKNHLWNPVNPHLEVKGVLALLSQAAAEPALAEAFELPEGELSAARRFLPWTRLLQEGAAVGPQGSPLADLPAFVAAHPRELVLKRSWDYGGKSVILAEDFEAPDLAVRMNVLAGRKIGSWADLTRFALRDPSGPWIVQTRVTPRKRRELVVTGGKAEWVEMVTDLSAFTGHGAAFTSSGLTSRASRSLVVNIVGGGGMAPVIPGEALAHLLG